ncbi:MAG: hypothetical protein L6R42_002242 [Xanthoria sp. 1 TBL-2021]|nr:MAG: hypothetical protein L6R42_002242 [Xanthoria sp. 1 TBL-2021]
MAPKKPPRRSTARLSASPSAATIPAAFTPSRRPDRPSAILTTPHTPSGPRLQDSGSSSIGGNDSGPSSTRSGRSYLPNDTGISPGPGSRQRRPTVSLESSPGTLFRRASGVVGLPDIPQTSIEDQFERAGSLAPQINQDRVSGSLLSTNQQQDLKDEDTHNVSRVPALNNEGQQTMAPTTKPFTSAENDRQPINIRHDNPASATTTTIPTRRTAMERKMQWFLSLPHEERHADHLSNPFAVPDDIDEWVGDNLGSLSLSPPSQPQMGNRAKWCMPPQPEHESLFDDLYERTMQRREISLDSENMGVEPEPELEPAMITAPLPEGITIPPRSEAIFPFAASEVKPTLHDKAMHQTAKATTSQQNPNYSIQPDCPTSPLRHHQGRYLHNDRLAKTYLPTFGTSNPPPNVWQAIHSGCLGIGTQHDADLITRFLAYHVTLCNFLVVPNTNFIWGHELHTRPADLQKPYIQLPFPVAPLRVRFDAGPNLPAAENGGENDALEQDQPNEAADHDKRRAGIRRRILGL